MRQIGGFVAKSEKNQSQKIKIFKNPFGRFCQISSTPKKLGERFFRSKYQIIACTDEPHRQILQAQCLSCVLVWVGQKILTHFECKNLKNWAFAI